MNFIRKFTLAIQDVYKSTGVFIRHVFSYLSKNDPEIPLFVHLIFPALYSFFATKEQELRGRDFILELIKTQEQTQLRTAFVISFFTSATLFLKLFWGHFFQQFGTSRFFSLFLVFEVLIDSLKFSVRFLSSSHLEVSAALIEISPELFVDFFLKEFLLPTFAAWVSSDVQNAAARLSEAAFTSVLDRIISDPDHVAQLCRLFTDGVESLCELPAYRESIDYPKDCCLLSPCELTILWKILSRMEKPKLPPQGDLPLKPGIRFTAESLECFRIEFGLQEAHPIPANPFHFPDRDPVKLEDDDGLQISLNTFRFLCKLYNLNEPRVCLSFDVPSESDTFHEKLTKSQVPDQTSDFKTFACNHFDSQNVGQEREFELYFERLSIGKQLEDVKDRLLFCNAILQFRMADQLHDPNCFPEQFFRTAAFDAPRLDEFMRHKSLFISALEQCSSSHDKDGFQELIYDNSSFLDSILPRAFPELPFGLRMSLFMDAYRAAVVICEGRADWVVRLLAHVFLSTDADLIYETFLVVLYFRKKYFSLTEGLRTERREALDGLKESFFEIMDKKVVAGHGTEVKRADVLARLALQADLRNFLDLDVHGR
jgi:hypothetical protein